MFLINFLFLLLSLFSVFFLRCDLFSYKDPYKEMGGENDRIKDDAARLEIKKNCDRITSDVSAIKIP